MLRDMVPADVDAVLAIEQEVQHYPWSRGNFTDALVNGYLCRVDEADGEIRGYTILMAAGEDAELLNIGVAEEQQRRGVGRAMLLEMLGDACARNILRVFLEVRASNVAALALYECAGFFRMGVRRGYYQNANGSEDAITMACELTGEIDGYL